MMKTMMLMFIAIFLGCGPIHPNNKDGGTPDNSQNQADSGDQTDAGIPTDGGDLTDGGTVADGGTPTDGGQIVTVLVTPTNLTAAQENDINAIRLRWDSHSTGNFFALAFVERVDIGGISTIGRSPVVNGEILRLSQDVTHLVAIRISLQDCLPGSETACSGSTATLDVLPSPLNLKQPTIVSITEVQQTTRGLLTVTYTDDSYGERDGLFLYCRNSNPPDIASPACTLIQGGWYLENQTQFDVNSRAPVGVPLWGYLAMTTGNLLPRSPWSAPFQFTLAP